MNHAKEAAKIKSLESYGRRCVSALKDATPIDSGKTAESWSYKIIRKKDSYILQLHNSNIQDGVNIAIILQYGHATKNGSWIEGRNYINPEILPLFENLSREAWEEVIKI